MNSDGAELYTKVVVLDDISIIVVQTFSLGSILVLKQSTQVPHLKFNFWFEHWTTDIKKILSNLY